MEVVRKIHSSELYVKKFRLFGIRTTFKFNKPPLQFSELDWLKKGFSQIVEEMKMEATASDFIGFTLKSLNLKTKEPGYVAFRPAREFTNDILWDIFGRIVQSNSESITSSDTFEVSCTRVNVPVGSGKVRPGLYNTFFDECKARRGIVRINNIDNLCLPRALVVAKAYAKKIDPKLIDLLRKEKSKRQTIKAEKLIAKSFVQIPQEGAGIAELQKFQEHLKKYKITVYNYDTKGRDVYYSGDNPQALYKINLLFHEGHYNVITSLTAAFACGYFCEACHTPFNQLGAHRCSSICASCHTISPPCKLEHCGITCSNCSRFFKNQRCYFTHQGTICKQFKNCKECNKMITVRKQRSPHVCGEVYCKVCSDFKMPNHKCYMQVDNGKPMTEDFLFIFFDFETRQDECLKSDSAVKMHKVNLCVSQQFCAQCIRGESCDQCVNRTRVFREDPVSQFMDYVMEVRKNKFKKVCVIAHNGQGFDFIFVLKYILEKTKFTPNTIRRGTKIILMEVDNVRFIDSLNFFPMALAALPKAFDLGPEIKKGYFPHLFNTMANQEYVGPMPPMEYYCPDTMFEKTYSDFEKWYNQQVSSDYVFDFKQEILEYCYSDVDILAKACIKFRTLFLEECNVDPFLEATTIASACNLAFRRNFLKPNTIGVIPKHGYRLADNQSSIALQWLTWEEEQRGVRIQHAGREREVKVRGMKVDGFDGERIYELNGCFWHGCPRCFPYKREEPLQDDPSDSIHLRYERTTAKIEKLKQTGYEVVDMWECKFNEIKKQKNLKYLERHPILNNLPLVPREAFFGGRTGNSKTYYSCKEGETIKFTDFCSLYPAINKYGKYPLGHPTIYVGHDECLKRGLDTDGLLKCKILPPVNLYHPVLPVRMHEKLMFVLCRTCGEELCPDDCKHNYEERALVGTWTMEEIKKAVEKGYVILEMYEMWQYEMATFEKGGLFTEFVNKFLKIKQESSGYPSWIKCENDKEMYIKEYFDKEGVFLDKEKIWKNEGLRSLAKLMLNSFWGKFGQRENQSKTLITREPQELFKLLTNPSIEVSSIQEVNEDVVVVSWHNLEEASEMLKTVNVVIAAYTTSQARLKLYEHLEKLDDQVCYYDTDSCIYIHKNGLYSVPTGDFLGEMTDELEKEYGPGSFITEFSSGGPKTYAYKVFSTRENQIKEICKVKGLTLNLKSSKIVNFNKLKQMVNSECPSESVTQSRIRRTNDHEVVTVVETKQFKVTGPKRRFEGDYDTLPFGYKKLKTN